MPPSLMVHFVAGNAGPWRIDRMAVVAGEGLAPAARLAVVEAGPVPEGAWVLRGATGNTRYAERREVAAMAARQEGLGRSGSRCAALVPIRNTNPRGF
jgi:hypothetical protein